MLQITLKKNSISPLPPNIKLNYTDVQLVSETSLYTLYEGKPKVSPDQTHTIRVFNNNCELAQQSYEAAATLFIKELLHLMTVDSNSVLLNTFEISDGGRQMAFAAVPYDPISSQFQITQNTGTIEETKEGPGPSSTNDSNRIKDMISDILLDVEFLSHEFGIKDCSTILTPQSIYRFRDSGACFLGDWCKTIMQKEPTTQTEMTETVSDLSVTRLEFKDIQNLALSLIELKGAKAETVNDLRELRAKKSQLFDRSLKGMFIDGDFAHIPGDLRELLENMLLNNVNFEATLKELETHKGPRRAAMSILNDLGNELDQTIQSKLLYEAEKKKAEDFEKRYNTEKKSKDDAYKFMRYMMFEWIKSLKHDQGYPNLPWFPNPNRPKGNPTIFFRSDADYWRRDFNDQFFEVFGYDLKEDYGDKYDTNNQWYQDKKKKSAKFPQIGLD